MSTNIDKVTIKQIADKAKVSEATVSRALNNSTLVKPKTRDKILKLANRLGYHPNVLARSIRTKNSHIIGIIIPNIANPFFTEVIRSIEDSADTNGYNVIIINTDESFEKEKSAIEILHGYMVSGFIIASVNNTAGYRAMLDNIPTVFIDRIPSVVVTSDSKFDVVLSDNISDAKSIVDELFKEKARHIGIIYSGVSTSGVERLCGYKKSLKSHNLPIDDRLIFRSDVQMVNTRDLSDLLIESNQCDAIFATDNTILYSVIQEIKEKNRYDIKIASFDNTQWFDFFEIPIISIQQPTELIGIEAVKRVLNRIKRPNLHSHIFRVSGNLIKR